MKHQVFIKKLLSASIMSFLIGLPLASAVYAQDVTISSTNDSTGSNSVNTSSVDVTISRSVTTGNSATVSNIVDTVLISGQNSATNINGDATIETGNAEVTGQISTEVNDAKTTFSSQLGGDGNAQVAEYVSGDTRVVTTVNGGGDTAITFTASNTNTGADSVNNSEISYSNSTAVNTNQSMDVTNVVTTVLDSGGNVLDSINGSGTIKTGDLTARVTIKTEGNRNVVEIGVVSDPENPPTDEENPPVIDEDPDTGGVGGLPIDEPNETENPSVDPGTNPDTVINPGTDQPAAENTDTSPANETPRGAVLGALSALPVTGQRAVVGITSVLLLISGFALKSVIAHRRRG